MVFPSEPAVPMRDKWMDRLVREVQGITGPLSYTTGGDPVSGPNDLGSGEIYGVYGTISDGTAVLIPWWDYTNQKLKFIVPNTGSEVANATDLTAYVGTRLLTCKG